MFLKVYLENFLPALAGATAGVGGMAPPATAGGQQIFASAAPFGGNSVALESCLLAASNAPIFRAWVDTSSAIPGVVHFARV